ncbi:unannotated protein [freshwater metagenome]|uniref:Unannotated protein n=1 Tax=freshwater metagenome TaxID=449393 RepID=A0A6J7GRK7_9ZZZZ|nr:MBL fold metallo-hydrolase [Actinomycetota bacterium]
MSGRPLPFIGSNEDWEGGSVTDSAVCVLAHNAGAWTLDGTNTWLLQVPGTSQCIVIDPGPDEKSHFKAILAAAELRDCEVGAVILTHGHSDHSAGAKGLAELTKTKVRAVDPQFRLGDEGLTTGDVIVVGETEMHVVATPGHSADSMSFFLPHDKTLLTGDTVLGRGTAVITVPDGDLGAYFTSLEQLKELVAKYEISWLLPGHGPALTGPIEILEAYVEHRIARLEEVREVVKSGAKTSTEVLEIVYADTPEKLKNAARQSVKAQLSYLMHLGEFTTDEDLTSPLAKALDVQD